MAGIIDRIKNILLTPSTEWPVIAGEPDSISGIYKRYLIVLYGISAVASLITMLVMGIGGLGIYIKVPFASALSIAVMQFVFPLIMIYVLAMIANALAPTFGGQKDMLRAFKLVAYAFTASVIGSALANLPLLGFLVFIGAIYSLYLLYQGLPVMMQHPNERNVPYFLVLLVCGILSGIVMAFITSALTPTPKLGLADDVTIQTPMGKATVSPKGESGGSVTIKSGDGKEIKIEAKADKDGKMVIEAPGAKMEIDTKKMEDLAKRMEEASKSGKPEDILKILTEGKGQAAPSK
jgi:hypothetical protein